MPDYALAIDLGTSGPKVALVAEDASIAGRAFEPTELLIVEEGGAEQRPSDWWSAIVEAVRRVLAETEVSPDAVVALSVTAQWSGTVPLGADGEPVMNAISWMDSRGAAHLRRLAGGAVAVEGYGAGKLWKWIRKTGGAPGLSGKGPLGHILWLRHERPELFAETATFLEPKDWVNYKLTGKLAAGYDSIALHWVTDNRDASEVRYDPGLLDLAGLERGQLPELKPATEVLGGLQTSAAEALGLREGTPVVMGTPDIHSAAIGSGGIADFDPHIYIGTSSWMVCHVPFKKTDLFHNMASLPSAIPGRYLLLNEQETAGACLNFMRDNVLCRDDALTPGPPPEDAYRIFDELAGRTPAGAEGLLFMPWLYGERTPIEDGSVRGGFFNLSLSSTRDHMLRAVMEGVALNSRWLLGYLEKFIGRPVEALRMIGGGARSSLWCQIYADVLGRPILRMADPIDAGARGAAVLAFVGLGRASARQMAERIPVAERIEPNPAHKDMYARHFEEFVKLYKNNRRAFARLNEA